MIWIVDKYLEGFDCESQDYYLIVSGQPKNLFDYALEETSKFCNVINRCYSQRVGFTTLSEVAKKVGRP
ncbi:MAG: hypothetical protein U9R03_03095, partial [Candidatus Aerophobetes bacterium]|nr:hypothetical protein [Candidatus Aerophobetes bacterium]